jgi:hypothetical protein
VDDKLAFYRQQYNGVAKKKNEKENTLKDLISERRELEKEMNAKQSQLDEVSPAKVHIV